MSCNTCYCTKKSLVCTKIACINWKPAKRKNSSSIFKSSLRNGRPNTGTYPELPKGPCEPGKIYQIASKKATCFCNSKQKGVCSKMQVMEKEVNVFETLKAIDPLFNAPSETKLPTLPNQSVKCNPGAQYSVNCNTCVCLHNNNLVCTKMLCLSYDDMNRVEAKKLTGQSCTDLDKVNSECMKCRCVKNKLNCEQVAGCVSTHLKQKLSHGGQPPKLTLNMDTYNCVDYTIYRDDCNLCFCRKNALRCTQKSCLKYRQVVMFKKQRLYLEQHGL